MALFVDSFEHLSKEIFTILSHYRDALALIGAYYVAKKTLSVTNRVLKAVKVHGLSRVVTSDLTLRYGPWAAITGSTHGIGKAMAQELASKGMNIIILSLGTDDCRRIAKSLVVTGCTGGIGQAFCEELASSGVNIVLISRSHAKLTEIADRLENSFSVQTHIIPVDFNDGKPVYEYIRKELEGKEIGILVNNVGVMYDYPQHFLDVPWEKLWQLVHVNVAAATMMTHLVMPQMVTRGRGAILTVASGASTMPTPQMTVYSATKAYLDFFIRALSYEYRHSGVFIQCLMPFYVATRMTQYSSTLSNPSLWIPTATTYARHALDTLGWSTRTTGYWPHTLQMWVSSWIPEWLWLWGATRLNNALRRQAHHRIRHRSGSRPPRRRPSSQILPPGTSLLSGPSLPPGASLAPGPSLPPGPSLAPVGPAIPTSVSASGSTSSSLDAFSDVTDGERDKN